LLSTKIESPAQYKEATPADNHDADGRQKEAALSYENLHRKYYQQQGN